MASLALKTFVGLRQSSPENNAILLSMPAPAAALSHHRRILRIKASKSSPRITGRNLRVAVVGGGPAGGCAAETLAKGGIETFLIERNMDNSKPCGGAIPLCMIEEFDIPLDIIDRRVTTMRLISPSNVVVDMGGTAGTLKPHEYMGMVRREVLDAFLRDRAATAGATVINGLFLKMDLPQSKSAPYVIHYSTKTGDEKTLEVDAVIGADGADSRVAKGIDAGDFECTIAIQERIKIPDDKMKYYEDLAEMYVGDDVSPNFYGWVYPKRDHVDVGTGTVTHKGDIENFQAATRFRARDKIQGGDIIRVLEAHPIPEHPRPRRVLDRVALVGDAAGYVTKCAGEGIYYAAKSGRMCAEAVVEGSEKGKRMVDESDMRVYLEKWDKTYGTTFKVLDILQKVFYRWNPGRETLVELSADKYVQRIAFDGYFYKRVEPGNPLDNLKLAVKTIGIFFRAIAFRKDS